MNDINAWVDGWLTSEDAEHDKISVKRIYIDLNDGNLYDALIFSQIMYWHGKNRETGKPRLRIFKDGHYWLAKRYEDWWEECRVEARQAKAAIARIHKRGLIVKTRYQFAGVPTVHIRMDWNAFAASIRHLMSNPIDTKCPMDQTPDVHSYTETTDRDHLSKTTPNKNNGDKAFQGEKPISAFSEKEEGNHQSGSIPVSTVGDRKKETPPNPRSEAPLSPKKRKLKVEYDRNGIVQFPKTGKHKLAGVFALRSTQIALSVLHLDFELGRDEDGQYFASDPKWCEWVTEDELFGELVPFTKMVDVLLCDQHSVGAGEINDELLEWFEYWSDRLQSAHLKPGNRYSVMAEVARVKDLEIALIEDEVEVA